MSRECERVGGINLGQGICDLPTIPELVEGACDAISSSKATYSKFEGIDLLREQIARKIEHFNGFRVDPAKVLFEPYYGYHLNTLRVLGVVTKFVPLREPDWSIDFDQLRAAFGPKTRGIIVCTPSNPCGKVFTREELEKIGALCHEFGAWAFTDEIYEYIVCDGLRHVSMASIESCRDIAITISGFSKTFSITGWRIGYAVASEQVTKPIGLLNDLFYICAPTPLQWGIARALQVGDDYYRDLAADYQKKRDLLAEALREAGFRPFVNKGAYYMLAEIPSEYRDDLEAAQSLLEVAGVASVPGSAFFASERGKRMLRFCYAKDFAALEEACQRIRAFRPVISNR